MYCEIWPKHTDRAVWFVYGEIIAPTGRFVKDNLKNKKVYKSVNGNKRRMR